MVNPAALLTFKKKIEEFGMRHPRFVSFIQALKGQEMPVGSIIDITVTMPTGETYQSNIKLTAEDLEMLKTISSMQ